MTWIDKKDELDTSGGWLRRSGARPARRSVPFEPVYSVAQVAEIFSVDKQTVYKWLIEEDGDSVIPPDGWYKLPGSGQIRIRHSAVLVLQQG